MATDFLGNELTPGTWVVCGAGGNTACEYGMILNKVVQVEPNLKMVRLTVSYPDHKRAIAGHRTSTITNTNKYVVVNPPKAAQELFERILLGAPSQKDHELVGKWLHGQIKGLFA